MKTAAKPKIRQFRLSDLNPAAYNPREISANALEGLSNSLRRFGCVEPIVVNVRGGKNVIVGGHQRHKALIELNGAEGVVDCVIVDLDATEEKLLNTALNNPHIQGDFSGELGALIESIRAEIGEEDMIGLRIEELRAELATEEKEGLQSDDKVPAAKKRSKTKAGDIYLLGDHRLMCGDSTKQEDAERLMAGEKADMVFTDPPYGASITGILDSNVRINRTRHWDMIEGDQFENEELQEFLERAFTNFAAAAHKRAPWYIWHAMLTQGFFSAAAAAAAADLILNRQIIWVKPVLILAFGDYHWRHELCFYGWRKGSKPRWYGPTNETTVWEVDFDGKKRLPNQARLHVTQKPVGLAERAISNSTRSGQIILDGFAGSGSTLIAAEKLSRRCYAMEIEPVFVDVVVKRWEEWTGKKAELQGKRRKRPKKAGRKITCDAKGGSKHRECA